MPLWFRTEFGEFALQLREGGQAVNLEFNPEADQRNSAPLLRKPERLGFRLLRKKDRSQWDEKMPAFRNLSIYFGSRPETVWNADLALLLRLDYDDDSTRTRWDADAEQVASFLQAWRCSAVASLTVCLDERRPIRALGTNSPALTTKIALGTEAWSLQLYRSALEELRKDVGTLPADITSAFETNTLVRQAAIHAPCSEPLELYYRLKSLLPHYERLLAEIVARPGCRLRREVRHFALETRSAAQYHQAHRSSLTLIQTHQAVAGARRRVPVVFDAVQSRSLAEGVAARFVVRSASQVVTWLSQIEGSIRAFVRSEQDFVREFLAIRPGAKVADSFMTKDKPLLIQAHEEAGSALAAVRNRIRQRVGRLRPDTAERLHQVEDDSAVLSLDSRYAELRRLSQQMYSSLRFSDYSEEAFPFEVEPWNVLYERWCLLRVVEALEVLGFCREPNDSRRGTPFYNRPVSNQVLCEMTHASLPGQRLQVWFERRYPRYGAGRRLGLETRFHEGLTCYWPFERGEPGKAKQTPDIALEFYRGSEPVPQIITLDPTLSAKPEDLRRKSEYLEAIRDFGVRDQTDGQSRRIVKAAWAIHPGWAGDTVFLRNQDEKLRSGKILLRPEPSRASITALPGSLRTILHHTGIAPDL